MRTRTTVALAVAAGLVGAGAVGVPAVLAADDDRPGRDRAGGQAWFGNGPMWSEDGDRMGMGDRMGPPGRMGGMGGGMGDGFGMRGGMGGGLGMGGRGGGPCGFGDREPAGKLAKAQQEQLAVFAEREKLARDLYSELAEATEDSRFDMLAWSESHHLRALQGVMEVYGVDDPTDGRQRGEFSDPGVAADYESMLEEGSGSRADALEVARSLEQDDIDRLGDAADVLEDSAPDVSRAYERLALASEHHLDVLTG